MRADPEAAWTKVAVSAWRAPMLSAAVVITAGIVVDRYASIPLLLSLVTTFASVAAWGICLRGPGERQPLVFLGLASAALGAAWHHASVHGVAEDDIARFAQETPRLARLRGVLIDEPAVSRRRRDDPLQSLPRNDVALTLLAVEAVHHQEDWRSASGKVRLVVEEPLDGPRLGDLVDVVGMLSLPETPDNPGGFDFTAYYRDRRIGAELHVRKTAEGIRVVEEGWRWSPRCWIAAVRGWGQRVLERNLPDHAGVATALLLGNTSSMTDEDWEPFLRTGVIHVLAISGQHLVVVAGTLWFLLRLVNVRRRRGAWIVAAFTLLYAALTGGRPPILRAAFMVCFGCGLLVARRSTIPANVFALAWIVIVMLNPADVFQLGCQLSFLAVAVLYWFSTWTMSTAVDPLQRLVEAQSPPWLLTTRKVGRLVARAYAATALVWLATTPLVAARQHVVAPVALLLGPLAMFLTSIALVAGFLLLGASLLSAWLATPVAWFANFVFSTADSLVRFAAALPGAYFHVPDIPAWWLVGFYLGLFLALTLLRLRHRWDWPVIAGTAWLGVGLLAAAAWPNSRELRVTFLAVGHGGAIVLETPDGRTLLYDTGSLSGPDVARRHVAPFLWHRGIRRIDDLFLSHADLDHFNGVPDLLERFPVGQVTTTPTFADRSTPGVRETLDALERRGLVPRVVRAGDRLTCGDVVLEVLHPPEKGPPGKENYRSLVLRVRHRQRTILLTGDLEGPGLTEVLRQTTPKVDVLMAPHHGSKSANPGELFEWARPSVVVSCQGRPRGKAPAEPYSSRGAIYLPTWSEGAVTIRSTARGLVVETFRTDQRILIR